MQPLDPYAPEFLRDPYPVFAELRSSEPVHRTQHGAWLLTRYDDVHAALGDDRLSNAPSPFSVLHPRNRAKSVAADVAGNVLPFLDPPDHPPLRRIIARSFFEHLKEHPVDIDEIVEQHWSTVAGSTFDVIGDYGTPISLMVIGRVLGVPESDGPRLKDWSRAFFRLFAPIPSPAVLREVQEALSEFRGYFATLLDQRAREPQPDYLTTLIAARDGDRSLSNSEIIDTCILLFSDGVENVDRALGNAMLALIDRPDQLTRLAGDNDLLPSAVEELLRFDSPAQWIARIAREPLEIRGVEIPKGHAIFAGLAAANRDPDAFADPETLDVGRETPAHLSFGRGRHSCLGGGLVADEMVAALRPLLRHSNTWTRSDTPLQWETRPGHRWLRHLHIRPAASTREVAGPSS